jgi:hypothetical protein
MKYTATITQKQYIRVSRDRKIEISPKGGDLSDGEVKLIQASAYGKGLINAGLLKIEGVKADPPAPPAEGDQKPKDVPVVEIKK